MSESSSDKCSKGNKQKSSHKNPLIERAIGNLKAKNDSRQACNSQAADVQLSQSMRSQQAEIQTSEKQLHNERESNEELRELCNRQQENLSKVRFHISQLKYRLENEVKNRDTFGRKEEQFREIFHGLQSHSQDLQDIISRAIRQKEKIEPKLLEIDQGKFQEVCDKLKSNSVQIFARFQQILFEKEMKRSAFEADSQLKLNHINQHFNDLHSSLKDQMSDVKMAIKELQNQLVCERSEEETIEMQQHFKQQEQTQEITVLTKQKEDLLENAASLSRRIDESKEEGVKLANELLSLKDQFQNLKARHDVVEDEKGRIQNEFFCLSTLFGEIKSQEESVTLERDDIKGQCEQLKEEMQEIRRALQDDEARTNECLTELARELQDTTTAASESLANHENLLDDLRQTMAIKSKEEEQIYVDLLESNRKVQELSQSYDHIVHENRCAVANNSEIEEELKHLHGEKNKTVKTLEILKHDISVLDESLQKSNESYQKSTMDHVSKFTPLSEEHCLLANELKKVTTEEGLLSIELQNLEMDSAILIKTEQDHNQEVIREYEEKVSVLKREIEKQSNESDTVLSEQQDRLKLLDESLAEKEESISYRKPELQKLQREFETHKNLLQSANHLNELREVEVKKLSDQVKNTTLKIDLNKTHFHDLCLALDKAELESQENDQKVSMFNARIIELKDELSELSADFNREKQVFHLDLVKFQQSFERRSDEKKELLRQLHSLKTLISDVQAQSLDLQSIFLGQQDKTIAVVKLAEEKTKKLEELQRKLAVVNKEMKQAEVEAQAAKRKTEHLNEKIQKSSAKRNLKSNSCFKVPPQDHKQQKETTPKCNIGQNDQMGHTPRSILKVASKPPTPQEQRKNVSFAMDFDDTASSSSSIILDADMIERMRGNSALRHVIAAEHHEKRQAAKRLKMLQIAAPEESLSPKKMKSSENVISSSTPEPGSDLTDELNS